MTTTLTGDSSLVASGFDAPPSNPFMLLQKWLQEAERLGVNEAKAFVLATVDTSGHPASRVVALKDCDETGIIFATSQASAKGKDLQSNPWAAAGTIDKIARLAAWYAYHLAPESIEFWHGNENRFHKRLRYERVNGIWKHQWLQP